MTCSWCKGKGYLLLHQLGKRDCPNCHGESERPRNFREAIILLLKKDAELEKIKKCANLKST